MEDDIEFVPENGEDFKVTDPVKKISDLKEKLKACQAEKQEYLDGWQRARADLLNFKNEEGKRITERVAYAKEDFVSELLPVLDSFDMAFANKEAWEKVDKNWRMGVEYIYNQLIASLEKSGVSAIGQTGVLFDPNLHQSIESVPTKNEADDHKVDKIIQKGYKIGDRIIRPARVAILEFKNN